MVKRDAAGVRHHHLLCADVDVCHLRLQHGEPPAAHLFAQDVADGRRHRGRGQTGRGHLVEQGLKQVVVGAVDERHLDLGLGQSAHSLEAAKTAADDHHPGQCFGRGAHRSVRSFQISGNSTTSSILRK